MNRSKLEARSLAQKGVKEQAFEVTCQNLCNPNFLRTHAKFVKGPGSMLIMSL
jgi:hypothetical protein